MASSEAPAPVGVGNIADWIVEMHADSARRYDYELRRIAVVAFGDDIVVTHYARAGYFVLRESGVRTLDNWWKITHTWKRYGDRWLIIGGMAGEIEEPPPPR